jgi:hypothetical protein
VFLGLLRTELAKLRDPMTLLTLVGGPAAVAVLIFLGVSIRSEQAAQVTWAEYLGAVFKFWAFFVFPLSLTAFAAFYAQVEHRARAWDHLLALPVPKWRVFAAKALVLTAATAAMHVLFLALALPAGALGGMASMLGPLPGPLGLGSLAARIAKAEGASLLMIAVQLWLSLRFSQFATPIMIGIGAYVATTAANIWGYRDAVSLFPWGVASAMDESASHSSKEFLLAYGLLGGLLAFTAMVVFLSRREMR